MAIIVSLILPPEDWGSFFPGIFYSWRIKELKYDPIISKANIFKEIGDVNAGTWPSPAVSSSPRGGAGEQGSRGAQVEEQWSCPVEL